MENQQENTDTPEIVIEEEKTIVLRKPVVLGGVTYAELNLAEPTAGQLSKASKQTNNVDVAIALISIIAKVPRAAVEALSQRDFSEANDFLASFTPADQTTGETS